MQRIKFLSAVFTCSFGMVLLIGVVYAGSLSPSANPAATSYTLTDIYSRLTTNATATAGDHTFVPSASPAATLYSMTQVYNAIPTITANTVKRGTSYLGVAGTLYGDTNSGAVAATASASGILMWNQFGGTAGSVTGGSLEFGGVDRTLSGDRYVCPMGWTQCVSGNNYCGTGLSSSDAKDNCTGLVWSLPCNGVGCSSFSDSAPLGYSIGSGGGNNNSKTAQQLCMSGSHGQSGWYLPHLRMLMQAYIDGWWGNLIAADVDPYFYWSSTGDPSGTLYYSMPPWADVSYSVGTALIRCIRPAL